MWLALLVACDPAPEAPPPTCAAEPVLFGAPSPNTGLDASACGPGCACPDAFAPPDYDEADVAAMLRWTLLEPPPMPTTDPYASGVDTPADGVCAVVVVDAAAKTYRQASFPNEADAEDAGAIVTHTGACGLCSSLEDLAAYVANPDLTGPVRDCGIRGAFGPPEEHRACLEALGFTPPCAEIWRYNTLHTREACLDVCLELLDAPYHAPDGTLNDCLQCDEDVSGPVFKAVAGRTRRNSGLPSALCRPCDTVARVVHAW